MSGGDLGRSQLGGRQLRGAAESVAGAAPWKVRSVGVVDQFDQGPRKLDPEWSKKGPPF